MDTEDASPKGGETPILTQVYILTDTKSSMQVAGFDEIMYGGPGSGYLFFSDAYHRSGFAEPGTIKIAFFFGHNDAKNDKLDQTYPLFQEAGAGSFQQHVGCRFCKERSGHHDSVQCNVCMRWIHKKCNTGDNGSPSPVDDDGHFTCKKCFV